MFDSHITDAQCPKTLQLDQFLDLQIDSDLLLSHISYQSNVESPQINVNAVEAKIKELTKTADPPVVRKSKPFCGCGQYYSCTSSLYLHIRSKHAGIAPVNTIGGPKGIVKKPNQDLQDQIKVEEAENGRYNVYQSFKSTGCQPSTTPPQQHPIAENLHALQNGTGSQVRRDENSSARNKSCKICGKSYSCNSSLNLHLKRKHHFKRLQNGRIEVEARPEDRQPKNFECTICGLNYGSKSALGLHYNNKHNSQSGSDQLPYSDGRVQKCGCGLIYQSRSALNMHVKKKHGGEYPKGTSQKPNLRTKGRSSDNYVFPGSDEEKRSIYDSQESDSGKSHQKVSSMPIPTERVFRCGCGRNYSCSSSLNLHIKKNHNWVVPKGTIGGPRGMRNEEERRNVEEQKKVESLQEKEVIFCGECNTDISSSSHFDCRTCDSHRICSNCFWSRDNFGTEHEWVIVDGKQ